MHDPHAPLSDDERDEIARYGLDRWLRLNQQRSWPLTLVDRHGIAWANGSHAAKLSLARLLLLPDLGWTWRNRALLRDESLVPLAIESLGPDVRHVRVRAPNGGEAGLRVRATRRAEALDIVRSLGLEPLVG